MTFLILPSEGDHVLPDKMTLEQELMLIEKNILDECNEDIRRFLVDNKIIGSDETYATRIIFRAGINSECLEKLNCDFKSHSLYQCVSLDIYQSVRSRIAIRTLNGEHYYIELNRRSKGYKLMK